MISWFINLSNSNKIAFVGVLLTFLFGLATFYQSYIKDDKSVKSTPTINQIINSTENIEQTFGDNSPIN